MTENEAKTILEVESTHHPECSMFYEALSKAVSALEEIQPYRALGTVRQIEDFIADWRKYRELGNLEELREVMEKQRTKKPKFYANNFYCSKCGNLVGNKEFGWQRFMYCDHCGNALDWSDEE